MSKIVGFLVLVLLAVALLVVFGATSGLKPTPKPGVTNGQTNDNTRIGELPIAPLKLPDGFSIGVFASGLVQPRDLEFSSGGVLLVSVPSQGKVVALIDENNDGTSEKLKNVLTGLNRPHGIAFYEGKLFVAEETRVVRYQWNEATLTALEDKVLFALPSSKGGHYTRSLVFDKNGRLFVSIGSTCNVCNEEHKWLASVIVSDQDGNNPRVWASGLRNSVFLSIHPQTGELWGTEMGRDLLGDNLPPDEINIIKDNKRYGWPQCYGKNVYDASMGKLKIPKICMLDEPPLYEIQAHSAPLGLVFIQSEQFSQDWQGDLIVAYHGSWNRLKPSGYKVVRLEVKDNKISGEEDFITGFLPEGVRQGPTEAYGRPVDLVFDSAGSLYISDDKSGVVYKIIVKEQ